MSADVARFIFALILGAAALWFIQDLIMGLACCDMADKPLWKWYRGRIRGIFSDKPILED